MITKYLKKSIKVNLNLLHNHKNMLIKTKKQVIELLKLHRTQLIKFGVNRFGLFGSFVRDSANENSDVDILVEFNPEQKTFNNFMNLVFFLEEILGRNVDLITVESLNKESLLDLLRN